MRRILSIVALACTALLTIGVVAASASDTQNFTFHNQGSQDSSTCGGNWANDTYTRVFKVYPEQGSGGSYRMVENFTGGHFTTIQGASPESCGAGDNNLVSSNLHGQFHGSETIKVVNGTFSNTDAGNWNGTGGTDGFITAAFGAGASNGNTLDYYFKYTTANPAACASQWVDAETGDSGDIATVCNP